VNGYGNTQDAKPVPADYDEERMISRSKMSVESGGLIMRQTVLEHLIKALSAMALKMLFQFLRIMMETADLATKDITSTYWSIDYAANSFGTFDQRFSNDNGNPVLEITMEMARRTFRLKMETVIGRLITPKMDLVLGMPPTS
jgi:hypothetical protein